MIPKPVLPLLAVAVAANFLTWLLYEYAAGQPGGTGAAMAFALLWMSALWIATMIVAFVIAVIKRRVLFKGTTLTLTIFSFVFATPVPAILFYQFSHPRPAEWVSSTEEDQKDGRIYKTEYWEKTETHRRTAIKRFVADSAAREMDGEKAFKRDSLWVYFDYRGDTVKVKRYRGDTMYFRAHWR